MQHTCGLVRSIFCRDQEREGRGHWRRDTPKHDDGVEETGCVSVRRCAELS